ncbi:MAG TPA: histidinol dehydrogenase [Flavitalea sp.]|nr:histidinol dehydrogenase [Flavitalea sp.]
MEVFRYPPSASWPELLKRPVRDSRVLESQVSAIIEKVRAGGDEALRQFTLEFDKTVINDLRVGEEEISDALASIDPDLKKAIQVAIDNITKFHQQQLAVEARVETMPGVECWRKSIGIERVGLYIPGGTAPLFSTVLMLAIPARIAGCREVILCSPPGKDGKIHPAVLAAAALTGVGEIFRVGGVQAIAAMAIGTQTIPGVFKIFGPGNQYVTTAKQLIQKEGVAIDMPAGPSEVAIFADLSANAGFVAADLLSQAEHGSDSQVLLVTDDESFPDLITKALDLQLEALPRKEFASAALAKSRIIVVSDQEEGMELLNQYAPEHLIIASDDALKLSQKVVNAGSVFLGHYTPESAGDYASGTNHTLPTNGYARAYSGVSVDSFIKKVTFQSITRKGLERLGPTVKIMAEAEGLEAHARAVSVRLDKI